MVVITMVSHLSTASNDKVDIVKCLLENGAQVRMRNSMASHHTAGDMLESKNV